MPAKHMRFESLPFTPGDGVEVCVPEGSGIVDVRVLGNASYVTFWRDITEGVPAVPARIVRLRCVQPGDTVLLADGRRIARFLGIGMTGSDTAVYVFEECDKFPDLGCSPAKLTSGSISADSPVIPSSGSGESHVQVIQETPNASDPRPKKR